MLIQLIFVNNILVNAKNAHKMHPNAQVILQIEFYLDFMIDLVDVKDVLINFPLIKILKFNVNLVTQFQRK